MLQHCGACGRYQHYPRELCHYCHSRQVRPVLASGLGQVYSFTTIHHLCSAVRSDAAPDVIALIELQEGPRIFSALKVPQGVAPHVGMQVAIITDSDGGTPQPMTFGPP